MTARKTLLVVGILFAVGEALDTIDVGLPALIFAVLFTIGVLLMRRGSRVGEILVAVLVVFEVAAWPTFDRSSTTDWLIQVPFLVVGLVGLAAIGIMLFRALRARRGSAAA